jgi:Transposase DDE domain
LAAVLLGNNDGKLGLDLAAFADVKSVPQFSAVPRCAVRWSAGARIKFQQFPACVAAIENSLIDHLCHTNIAPLAVPDLTTLSRRANSWRSPDQRQVQRHQGPVHVLIDSTGLEVYGGEIIAHVMTDQEAGDASQVEMLLDQIDDPIGQFTADSAYDARPTYDAVIKHSAGAAVVIPPPANAVGRPETDLCCQRDRQIEAIRANGRMKWQATIGYGKRSLVENAIGGYTSSVGPRLRARSFGAQQTEVAIGCAALNRMLSCARPKSVHSSTDASTPSLVDLSDCDNF